MEEVRAVSERADNKNLTPLGKSLVSDPKAANKVFGIDEELATIGVDKKQTSAERLMSEVVESNNAFTDFLSSIILGEDTIF